MQAVSGLMEAHGREEGIPVRLGIDVASLCAGVLAAQSVLAARLATLRGARVWRAETSVVEGALQIMAHHIAYATSGDDWMVPPDADGPGPPFRTADGHWIEIEALTMESWHNFWSQIGVAGVNLDTAALAFVLRYTTARCRLPAALNEAIALLSFDQVMSIAGKSGVAVCALRSPDDVAGDDTLPQMPWAFHAASAATHAAPHSTMPPPAHLRTTAPLAGVRVVEATSRLQGPLAGLLLRMLGADVVKIEPPGGDTGRIAPPRCGDDGAFFVTYNHGKETVELDLHTSSGGAALMDAIAGADVFLHNWRPGRAEELGVDADAMLARNPSLVWAHASGWGDIRPVASAATEYLVQAHAACGAALRPSDEPPFPTRLTIVDTMGGLIACEGILAALVQRETTGAGCRVATSLLSAALTLQSATLRSMHAARERTHRDGRPRWGAFDRPLCAGDGWILVVATDEASVARALDACDAGSAPAHVAERLRSASVSEWEARFAACGVATLRVCTDLASLERSPYCASALHRRAGGCVIPRAPWRFAA